MKWGTLAACLTVSIATCALGVAWVVILAETTPQPKPPNIPPPAGR